MQLPQVCIVLRQVRFVSAVQHENPEQA